MWAPLGSHRAKNSCFSSAFFIHTRSLCLNNTNIRVRKYSAVTPGGMSKEVGGGTGSASKFPAVGKAGKKATTLFLQATLLARVSRKLGRDKVSPRHPWPHS